MLKTRVQSHKTLSSIYSASCKVDLFINVTIIFLPSERIELSRKFTPKNFKRSTAEQEIRRKYIESSANNRLTETSLRV
jgi:hypothetical protein